MLKYLYKYVMFSPTTNKHEPILYYLYNKLKYSTVVHNFAKISNKIIKKLKYLKQSTILSLFF